MDFVHELYIVKYDGPVKMMVLLKYLLIFFRYFLLLYVYFIINVNIRIYLLPILGMRYKFTHIKKYIHLMLLFY